MLTGIQGRVLTFALLALLILKGFPALIRMAVLPQMIQNQERIVTRISKMLGMDVSLNGLSADMSGWSPRIHINEFVLKDIGQQPVVVFDDVDAGLNLFLSLLRGQPAIEWLRLTGGDLSLERSKDGSFQIAGMQSSDPASPEWLLDAGHIYLHDLHVRLVDLAVDQHPSYEAVLDAEIANEGNQHHLAIQLDHAGELGHSLRAMVDLAGTPEKTDQWKAQYYVKADAIQPANWPGVNAWREGLISAGQFDLELWGNTDHEQYRHKLAGYLSSQGVTSGGVSLPDIDTRVDIERINQQWEVTLQSRHEGNAGARIRYRPDAMAETEQWVLFLPYLDLAPYASLRAWLVNWMPEQSLVHQTSALAGIVRNTHVVLSTSRGSELRQWEVCGYIEDFLWASVPVEAHGIHDIDISFCGNQDTGKAKMSLHATQVTESSLSPRLPIIEKGQIDLGWTRQNGMIYLTSDPLKIDFDEVSFRGHMQLIVPEDLDFAKAYLDARLDMGSFSLVHLQHYLPRNLIPSTSEWLVHAIREGWVDHSRLIFHGLLADFPFRNGQGSFRAEVHVRDVSLNFAENWKDAEHIDGLVFFDGPDFGFEVNRGSLGSNNIEWVRGQSSDLSLEDRHLWINGELQTSLAHATHYLRATPLGKSVDSILQFAKADGEIHQALSLDIPFDNIQTLHYSGETRLLGGHLKMNAIDEPLTDVRGSLFFDETHLTSEGIEGKFGRQAMQLQLDQQGEHWLIRANGWWTPGRISQKRGNELQAFVSGETPFSLQLESGPDDHQIFQSTLTVNSSLTGLNVDLPEPWGKQAAERRDSSLKVLVPTPLKPAYDITANYGQDFRAELRMPSHLGNEQTAVLLMLGSAARNGQLHEGYQLLGKLETFDADAFLEWMKRHALNASDQAMPEKSAMKLEITHLRYKGQDRQDLLVMIEPDAGGFRGRLDSFLGKGHFQVIQGEPGLESINLNLDQLIIPDATASSGGIEATPDPRSLPSLSVNSRSLLYRGQDLGRFQLSARHQPGGMAISQISLESDVARINLQGEWLILDQHEETHLRGQGHVDNLGNLLEKLGVDGVIRDSPTDIKADFHWHAWPFGVSLARLIGDVDIHMGSGALTKIEVGIGRVFGALSISQIWRRLSLDFSDLWAEGMAYNELSAKFQFNKGLATTQKFLLDGVAANVSMTGTANLSDRTLYQEVQVIPETGIALPVAGLILGGPVGPIVGAAALVAESVFSQQVGEATQTHYVIQGSWDNPSITRIYGNNPADLMGRAWKGIKGLSGMNEEGEIKP